MSDQKKVYKRIALTFSLCLLLVWALLGTSASLAWFADTSPSVKNIFHFAEFDLEVSYRAGENDYQKINGQTNVFDEQALYEPGYVQVVYLKVENKGSVPFDFKVAVGVSDYTPSVNVFGKTFNLQDHLKYGVVTASSEAELDAKLAAREQAVANADMPLNKYFTQTAELAARDETYIALIVRMPETVGNEANYQNKPDNSVPEVKLGLIVSATQQTD